MLEKIINLIIVFASAALMGMVSEKILQIYQLSSYRVRGVLNWFKVSKFDFIARYFALAFLSFIGMFVFVACFSKVAYVKYIGFLFMIGFSFLFFFVARRKNKVKLKITARMVRLIILSIILIIGAAFGLIVLGSITPVSYSMIGILPFLTPFLVLLAGLIILPIETLNNFGYKTRAMQILEDRSDLIKIGITGSFGKTTAKNILAAMLQKKYKVCYSPASYNTPMGLSKVINNTLTGADSVFIAEMGARSVGDIKELACMIKPNYALITAIGNQHLETFGNIENIKKTKFELVENMAIGGHAGFNGDSDGAMELYNLAKTSKFLSGKEGTQNAFITYKNVKSGKGGTSFTLVMGEKEMDVTTKLLGRHIPSLVTLCAGLSYSLGITPAQIKDAIKDLEPVPHRLELIENGDMIIIDDAYNSNTEGAKNALLVLKDFEGVKIVVTPGLVELGEEEKPANTALGTQIGECADYAILVGERGLFIQEGALKAGMKEDKIFLVANLFEATSKIREIEGKKVVLFENDLPDNY